MLPYPGITNFFHLEPSSGTLESFQDQIPVLETVKHTYSMQTLSDCAWIPASIVTCRVSSFTGWNSHKNPPVRQSLRKICGQTDGRLNGCNLYLSYCFFILIIIIGIGTGFKPGIGFGTMIMIMIMKKLHHSSHIRLIRRPINKKVWNSCMIFLGNMGVVQRAAMYMQYQN
jgi:hypothetical protein